MSEALERQLFGVLAEHSTEAMLALHRTTERVVAANRHFAELTGRPRTEVVGMRAADLLAPDSITLGQILERAGLHEDVVLLGADGYPIFLSLSTSIVELEGEPLCVWIARDTTERRHLEREVLAKHVALFATHAELERVVASLEERNRELAMLGAQLSQAARRALIGELSAGIAHSLNNPLAALASTHQRIVQSVEAVGDPALVETVRRLSRRSSMAIERMERIVQSVQTAHRSGAMSSDPRMVPLIDEVETALALFDARLRSHRVVREFTGQPMGWLPPGDLQHVLWNLFDNALLAMPEGGELTIHVAGGEDGARLSISDSGPGVSPALLPTLFQPFNSTRREGSGLGLSTARRLARAWGGDVELVPSPVGARFEVRIPSKENPCGY